ncbi:MAG: threonine-phosphate decarboxylase [Deltaproteobacteria bacterium]|nr:threonine-phosphate decarboxylase [Deltaproteobacteria bacterium]
MVVEGSSIYRHGGFRPGDFRGLNIPERAVLDFSVSLNPLGPPSLIREKWAGLFDAIEHYPPVHGEGVATYYEKKYAVPPSHFIAGNGSTEMIYLIPRAFGLKRVLVVVPSYHDYSRASLLCGASVRALCLRQEEGSFGLDMDGVFEGLKDADALWLGNPNNPTGTLLPRETVREISRRFPEKWIIVDEAFMPFVAEAKDVSLLRAPRPKNILVVHSLTKFYALAGIRIGGVVASEEVVQELKRFKEPWTVNGVAERIAPLLLECGDYEEKTLSFIAVARERLRARLRQIEGLVPFNGHANFILSRWSKAKGLDDLLGYLLSQGIYVRDCRNFPGLGERWFRVAVRTDEENDFLVSAMASFSTQHDA